jgi:hypothetical protein
METEGAELAEFGYHLGYLGQTSRMTLLVPRGGRWIEADPEWSQCGEWRRTK